MGSTLGRGGRRRRVLNEEIVAASGTHAAYRSANPLGGNVERAARYGEAASAKHHPRVSDFVARRCRTIWIAWAAGAIGIAGLVAVDACRGSIAQFAGTALETTLALAAPGSIAGWFSSLLLLLAAAHAVYIYSLRRHRLGDYRGRYRVWMWAAAALFLLSANATTACHAALAAAAAHLVGWTALEQHAVWWLAPGCVFLGAIAYGTLRDAWESRLARLAYAASLAAFALGLAAFLGDASQWGISSELASRIAPTAVLVGNLSLLVALAAYARFVSLDAEGLIDVPNRDKVKDAAAQEKSPAAKTPVVKSAPPAASASSPSTVSISKRESRVSQPAPQQEISRRKTVAASEWVDGRTPIKDDFDSEEDVDADGRKLSKSERKRLRKFKSQTRRAA